MLQETFFELADYPSLLKLLQLLEELSITTFVHRHNSTLGKVAVMVTWHVAIRFLILGDGFVALRAHEIVDYLTLWLRRRADPVP